MSLVKKIYWDINLKRYNIQKDIHDLKSLAIEITNLCNLNCKHCYMDSIRDGGNNNLTKEEWMSFFKQFKKDFSNKIFVQITGEEPLIRSDILEILRDIKELGLKVSLATNGTLLDEQKIIQLNNYLVSLSISLDGFAESHNYLRNEEAFERVVENIKLAVKNKINYLVIKTVVFKRNLVDLDAFYTFLNNLSIHEWHIFPMELLGRGRLNKEEALSSKEYEILCDFVDRIKKDKGGKIKIRFGEEGDSFMYEKACDCKNYKLCSAGISSCAILYNGDIVNCIQEDRSNLGVQGNIKRDNFKDIWENKFLSHRDINYRHCKNHTF